MSENCNICWRPTSTNRWCGPDMCSAYWAGRHPGADLAMAVCYRIGRELVMAERDALRAERDALLHRAEKAEEERDAARWLLDRLRGRVECRRCDGTGGTLEGTGNPNGEGGEEWRWVDCELCGGQGWRELPPAQEVTP